MKTTGKQKQLFILAVFGLILVGLSSQVKAGENITAQKFADMPVKEITVFKDGHAFVLHEGAMPTDAEGNVTIDYLPRPVIGTFWSYSSQAGAKLTGVVSGNKIVSLDKTSLTIPELIQANTGAKVRITQAGFDANECVIQGIPERSSEELDKTSPPASPELLPQQGSIVLLKYKSGIKAVPIENIREVTFLEGYKPTLANQEFRDIMTLKLNWDNNKPAKTANVGMVYVQRGIRWIPNYKVEIDGKGQAVVKLQATIVNELADIKDVKAHLVVGVPTFAFKETVDPISLQQTVAQLSSALQSSNQTAYSFSNAIMTQVSLPVRSFEAPRNVEVPRNNETTDLGPNVAESGKSEDLYIFTLEHITLKKGQRMVVPVAEYKLKYKDVFVLDLPFGPPPEVRQNFNNDQTAQLARLLNAPKVMHKIRLNNTAECPLTTAPAMIMSEGRIIAQGMMTYTAVGASSVLELTTAVDVSCKKTDIETERTPNAAQLDGLTYARSNLKGTITLTNHRTTAVELEINRSVMGTIDSATGGKIEQFSTEEAGWFTSDSYPFWWNWYSWPYWWYHFNPVGRASWEMKLEPGKSVDLEYTWHYFWRT
jgi:hypothetical protein